MTGSRAVVRKSEIEDVFNPLNQSICEVPWPEFPPMVQSMEDFQLVRILEKTSCHEVSEYVRISGQEATSYFFKTNVSGYEGLILEALNSGFSALVSPAHAAITYIARDEKYRFVGLLSRGIPAYETTSTKKLEKKHLEPSMLDAVPLPMLDALLDEFIGIDDELKRVDRVERAIALNSDKEIKTLMSELKEESQLDGIRKRKEYYNEADTTNLMDRAVAQLKLNQFYQKIAQEHSLMPEHMETYRILKGHAVAFSSAILGQDADFHRNNFSRLGEHCDFGYRMRPVSTKFEGDRLNFCRDSGIKTYYLSAEDFIHFPNIRHAKPFLWPTCVSPRLPVLPTNLVEMIYSAMDLSANSYPVEDTLLYQQLEKNRYFAWNKCARFFRYLLLSPDIFQAMTEQFVLPEQGVGQLIRDALDNQNRYYAYTANLLMTIEEFLVFFRENGAAELTRFENEFLQHSVFESDFNDKMIAGLRSQFSFLTGLMKSQKMLARHPDMYVLDDAAILSDGSQTPPLSDEDKEDGDIVFLPVNRRLLNFSAIKAKVIEGMQEYQAGVLNATLTLFGMSRRHHQPLAEAIVTLCHSLNPNPRHRKEAIQATYDLYEHLVSARKTVIEELGDKDEGLMLKKLNYLISQIEEHSIDFIRKNQPAIQGPLHSRPRQIAL